MESSVSGAGGGGHEDILGKPASVCAQVMEVIRKPRETLAR